ncbi:MAG: hypothetical protein ABI885_12560 [Gammaproteobacteria bacterium]
MREKLTGVHAMFIFSRTLCSVGAGLGTALAIVAASYFLNRSPTPPHTVEPTAVKSATTQVQHPAS